MESCNTGTVFQTREDGTLLSQLLVVLMLLVVLSNCLNNALNQSVLSEVLISTHQRHGAGVKWEAFYLFRAYFLNGY